MMYIATCYLPALRRRALTERAHALVSVLPYYSPWTLVGVLLMAVTGPFSATFQLTFWDQLLSTAYGRALSVKVLLVGALLLTSTVHVLLLRPRLAKEYTKYVHATRRLQVSQATPAVVQVPSNQEAIAPQPATKLIAGQVRLREGRLAKRTRLAQVLRWEPLLGVAVLVCVGLMNVFAGTLSPIAAAGPQSTPGKATSFHTAVKTTDRKSTIALTIDPNTAGPNVFTVEVRDTTTGRLSTDVGVSLYTTHLDMDMGTDTVNLQPDGKGRFSATGDLVMGGHWQIRIQIRTSDTTLHEATVKVLTAL